MAEPLNLSAVRARFPSLVRTGPGGLPVVHADAPGGTQIVGTALDAMVRYLRQSNANAHGRFPASAETDALCDQVRAAAGAAFGCTPGGVVFGPNMTTLTWHFSRALDPRLGPGDNLVCTRLDHDANVAPWLALAARTGAQVRWVDLDAPTGRLRTADLETVVDTRTRLIAFPAASNALGTIVDCAPFVAAARSAGAITFLDAVHAAPHVPLSRAELGVDVLVCSAYKFFGPHAGLLLADEALLAELQPDKVRPSPDEGPERWQTGTAAFEAIAGTGAAIDYLASTGLDAIAAWEAALSAQFLDGVAGMGHVRLFGTPTADGRTPTFAVTVAGHAPAAVADALAARGIYTWAGHYYAVEALGALGLLDSGGAVRIGFVHYHGPADVDRVLEGLAALG